jgi:hypothetical protein
MQASLYMCVCMYVYRCVRVCVCVCGWLIRFNLDIQILRMSVFLCYCIVFSHGI